MYFTWIDTLCQKRDGERLQYKGFHNVNVLIANTRLINGIRHTGVVISFPIRLPSEKRNS